jgi:AhpD family alkylhydroperoxidase
VLPDAHDLMERYQKKMWTPGGFLADHREVLARLPGIALAYVGPRAVAPRINEAVMVTVNSVNACPYCEGLHGQLARMAGVEGAERLMKAGSERACRQVVDDPAISFARVFAEHDGRGEAVEQAARELASVTSAAHASSVRALCWFLLWGSIGGNTLNGFFARLAGRAKTGSSAVFELLFALYYGPLFLVIAVTNALLRFTPRVPAFVSAGFGLVLTVIAGTWILVPGLLGTVVRTKPRVLAFG